MQLQLEGAVDHVASLDGLLGIERVLDGLARGSQAGVRARHVVVGAGDELLRPGHRPELPGRPEDLGLGESSEPLGPRAESVLPVDLAIDSRAGNGGDLRLLPDNRREFGEELVENQGVL